MTDKRGKRDMGGNTIERKRLKGERGIIFGKEKWR